MQRDQSDLAQKRADRRAMIAKLPPHDAPALDYAMSADIPGNSALVSNLTDAKQSKDPEKLWLIIGFTAFLAGLLVLISTLAVWENGSWLLWPGITLIIGSIAAFSKFHQQEVSTLTSERSQLGERLEELEDQAWELRESEERYRSLAEAFGDLVMHRTSDGIVTFANAAFANAFGKKIEDIVGSSFDAEIFDFGGVFSSIDNTGRVNELCIETENGKKWYSWLDLPFRDDATGKSAIRSIARDVTQHKLTEIALRKASENALSASRAKSRFLANVSHEMRTPLNGILGMSDLLSDSELTPDQTNYNRAVHTSGAALLSLVEDILDITRIEANHFEIRNEKFSLDRLVENVCELLSVRAQAKGIVLSTYFSNRIPDWLMGDEGRLRQVLINLVGNAVKFTEKGEVILRVNRIENQPGTEDQSVSIRFEVEDTGPGLSELAAKQIFGEFVQVDEENTRKHGGAGLGLTISKGIISQMGSDIGVTSTLGSGSKFHFEVTFQVCVDAGEIAKHSREQIDSLVGKNILIVSRTKFESDSLARSISDAGGVAQVTNQLGTAYSALSCAVAAKRPYNSVMLENSMSRNPVRSLEKLKAAGGGTLRSVVLLPPEDRRELEHYLDNGFDAFLIQPVRIKSLLHVMAGGIEPVDSVDSDVVEETPKQETSQRSLKILLAEDNDINALLATSVLDKTGHNVARVENGRQAVAEFRNGLKSGNPYDLVLMDLQMPVMDGLEAVSRIRNQEKSGGHDPAYILILTADEQTKTRIEASEVGADGYLIKPFIPARLIELAREVASIKRS